jgi:PBP1b-binding outer membrane lipoprotein LpoB
MKLKIIISILTSLVLLAGCSSAEEKTSKEPKQEQSKKIDPNKSEQNKELTNKVNEEKGVIGGQVYTQENTAICTLVLEKKVNNNEANKLAEKYAEELKKEYKDMRINVQAVRDGKNVANITKD